MRCNAPCMAPRKKVSSISATAMPLPRPLAISGSQPVQLASRVLVPLAHMQQEQRQDGDLHQHDARQQADASARSRNCGHGGGESQHFALRKIVAQQQPDRDRRDAQHGQPREHAMQRETARWVPAAAAPRGSPAQPAASRRTAPATKASSSVPPRRVAAASQCGEARHGTGCSGSGSKRGRCAAGRRGPVSVTVIWLASEIHQAICAGPAAAAASPAGHQASSRSAAVDLAWSTRTAGSTACARMLQVLRAQHMAALQRQLAGRQPRFVALQVLLVLRIGCARMRRWPRRPGRSAHRVRLAEKPMKLR